MAGQQIIFDFLSRGAGTLAGDFRKVGDDAALSSRGVQVLGDIIEKLGSKEDRTAAQSVLLAKALKQTGDAADTATAKAVLADAAIGRLGEQMKQADSKSSGLTKSLKGLSINPGLAGPLVALTPALVTLSGVAVGAAAGLAGSFVAGGAALAAFGAVAKPVLTSALTASQAVNKAQDTYQQTIKAGVPTAQAQATLQAANARAVLTYNAAIAAGANPAKALAAEHLALARNQVAYNTATNAGTFNAKAYAAEQKAISAAYADLSPQQIALSKQLGAMADSWQKVKAAQTPVVSGALVPWLQSITSLTKQLGPIIAAVSPVIARIGTAFNTLINSSAFTTFRNFIAGTGSQAVGAAGNLLTGFLDAVITLLPKFNPLIQAANRWLSGLGDSIARWANSQKTADQITAFMAWFTRNGPQVGQLLTNIGGALKALAPGLTTGAAVELKIISDFFGLVAKLPPAFAKPLAEVAGAMLVLSKMGVLKVGVQLVGAAVKWLTGGLISIGGGETAAAAMRAAFATGGTAAAAEMRAALAGGGATAGAAGAAGKGAAGAGAAGGAGAAAGAALGVVVAGAFAGALIKAIGDTLSPNGTFAGRLNKMFQGLSGPVSASVFHAFTFGGLEAWLTAKIGLPVGGALNNVLAGAKTWGTNIAKAFTGTWTSISGGAVLWWHNITGGITGSWASTLAGAKTWVGNIASTIAAGWTAIRGAAVTAWNTIRTSIASAWTAIWANTRSVVSAGITALATSWRTLESGVTSAYNTVRTSIATAWTNIWNATRTAVTTGIANVVSFFTGLPGKITAALGNALNVLKAWGSGVINGLLQGMTSVITQVWDFIKSIPGKILSFLGIKSPPQWAIDAGKHIMNGLGIGMTQAQGIVSKATAASVAAAAAGALHGIGTAGVSNSSAVAALQSAAAKKGWTGAQWAALVNVEMREAGFSLTATNPSSGAYGMAQFINGPSEYAQYGGNSTTAAGQAVAMVNYIAQRYGNPAAAWAHELAFGWYAGGTNSARPGWAWVGERGPELVRFRGGEQVLPHGSVPGGDGGLAAELRALRGQMAELIRTTAAVPAATGAHVGGAISGAAGAAAMKRRFPNGGW